MRLQLITSPSVEPVSLEEAVLHCRVDSTADYPLVRGIVQAAREWVEQKTGRALIEQRWQASCDAFPSVLELGHPPLVAVESVKYYDTNGVDQTVSSLDYLVDLVSEPARIVPAYAKSWPSARCQPNSIRARFIAGYACGVTADASTDTLTHSGLRTIANDQVIRLSNSGGALPGGLAAGKDYFVVQTAGAAFKLSLTQGGSAIDITDAGTGSHFIGEVPKSIVDWMLIAAATMYEHREQTVAGVVSELKFVDRLLDRYTVPRL